MIQVVLQSFQVSKPGEVADWGLDGWEAVFTERALQKAVLQYAYPLNRPPSDCAGRRSVCGVALSSNGRPGAKIFEFIFWLAFFLPSLTVTLSWILVADPQFGLLNQLLRGFQDGDGPSISTLSGASSGCT